MSEADAASGQSTWHVVRLPVESLARYAGLTALATGVVVVAGLVSTGAYLSAWDLPVTLTKFDPVTTALRAENVIVLGALLASVTFGLHALRRRTRSMGRPGRATFAAALIVLGGLAVLLAVWGLLGFPVAIIGGVALFAAYDRRWISERTLIALLGTVVVVAAYITGLGLGVLVRDDARWRTPLALSTELPVEGLPGATRDGGVWRYGGLYFVFRDADALYVSAAGAGARAWIVPLANVAGIAVGHE